MVMREGGWFRASRNTWDSVIEALPKPISRAVAFDDLERWRAGEAVGDVRPSLGELMERWGWGSRSSVRRAVMAVQTRYSAGTPAVQTRYSAGTPDAPAAHIVEPEAVQQRYSADTPAVQDRYMGGTPPYHDAAPVGIVGPSREETEIREETETMSGQQATRAGEIRAVWEAWRDAELPSGIRPHAKSRVIRTDQHGHISARLSEGATVEDLIAIVAHYHGPSETWRHDKPTSLTIGALLKPKGFEGRLETATASRATVGRTWDTDPEFAKIREAAGKGRAYATREWPGDAPSMRASRQAAGQLGLLTEYNIKTRTPEIYRAWKEAQ